MKQQQTKGRPKGAKNVDITQIVESPRCPACGRTDRTPYRLVSSVDHPGTTASGTDYTHVVTRRTQCTACQRVRNDKFFENRQPLANPGDENEPSELPIQK